MFSAVLISGSLLGGGPAATEKLTVADVLKGLSLDESKLVFADEPPGKLRALEFEATLRDTAIKVRGRIELVYTPELFSDQRKWTPGTVRAAAVSRVTIRPLGGGK